MRVLLLLMMLLVGCEPCFGADYVTRIIDGDTFELASGEHVRLVGVDAPERGQPGSKEATQALSVLILDRAVELEGKRSATWGRKQAVVVWRGYDIAEALTRWGHAWVDSRHTPSGKLTAYREAETHARNQRRGLWADANPIAPWDWRDGKRSVSAIRHAHASEMPRVVIAATPPTIVDRPIAPITISRLQYSGTMCVGGT